MIKKHHHTLIELISGVKSTAQLYIDGPLSNELIEECIRCSKRGIALSLYFSDSILGQIDSTPFLLNKLYQLREAGASIYSTSNFKNKSSVCQRDFVEVIEVSDENNSFLFKKGEKEFSAYQHQFEQIDQTGTEFRLEPDDIDVRFTVDNHNVIENTATEIRWDVRNALKVEIDGIGNVPAYGKRSLTILKDTILNIRASNSKQVKVKSLSITTIQKLDIDYDVQFLNPASKHFVSLKEEDNMGVYGVAKGNKIKLVWNVDGADHVLIKPFKLKEKSGEHTFYPDGTLEINIQASLQGNLKNCRIIIHEFPMPAFEHNYIAIADRFLPNVDIEIKDKRSQAFDYLGNKEYLKYNDFTKRAREHASQHENNLLLLCNKMEFLHFYNNNSIPKLHEKIRERLIAYFRNEPSILSIINSLRNYYE